MSPTDLPPGSVLCDAYLEGVEQGEAFPWGWRYRGIDNVDHHARDPRMQRPISSANLAISHRGADRAFITHTDCDSIVSAAMIVGRIAKEERFADSAVAADHTGAEDVLADALQGLEHRRRLALSLGTLDAYVAGAPLPPEAEEALRSRQRERALAHRTVAEGLFAREGDLAWAAMDYRCDGVFLPTLMPEAKLIATFTPSQGRLIAKLRLGLAARVGATLHDLNVRSFDPAYGGRWNAGSNRRGGGCPVELDTYVAWLREAVERL